MVAAAFLLSLFGLATAPPSAIERTELHNPLIIQTTSGRVHGKIDLTTPNTREFLGIPYAAPPIGDLRWKRPQPAEVQDVDATKLPPSCVQYLAKAPFFYNQAVTEFSLQGLNHTGSISEDCLTLSVWTPLEANHVWPSHQQVIKSEPLPVLIYLPGGGFQTGGQDVPYQNPKSWVQRSQQHIVVTINYRLNIFGFPNAPGVEDNLGLLDQRMAVEWVRDNIAAFGGDPKRMILWGQSAGSMSASYYSYAWAKDPIVKGLILNSGTAQTAYFGTDPTVITKKHSSFNTVAAGLGCKDVECMRGIDALTINEYLADYQHTGARPAVSFRVTQDDKIVFGDYTARSEADIPAIIATDLHEGAALAPAADYKIGPHALLSDFVSLEVFFCPATETARLRQERERLTYRYIYSGNFTNVSPAPWMGAYHAAELPLIFGTHADFRGPSTDLEIETSKAMQDAYVAFAADPKRGLQRLGWKPYSELGQATVREFGAGVAYQDVSVADEEAKCNGNMPAFGKLGVSWLTKSIKKLYSKE